MLTLHLSALKESKPLAIIAERRELNGDPKFHEEQLSGDWFRVIPTNGADVRFLQCLEHQLDKFAPARGGGVLIHPRCMPLRFPALTVKRN